MDNGLPSLLVLVAVIQNNSKWGPDSRSTLAKPKLSRMHMTNPDTAYSKIRSAAEQGDAAAQSDLSVMLSKGYGAPRNYKLAFTWCKLSAVQGNARAQCNLGVKYYEGKGVEKDYVRAHMWLNISARNGVEGALRLQQVVSKMMSHTQIEKAQDWAGECIKKNYKGF